MKVFSVTWLFFFCILYVFSFGQEKPRPYLLDTFTDGVLYYSSALPRKAKFNYHLVGQEIVMDFNNNKVPVNQFPDLDSVHIGNRNFILLDSKSYELLIRGPVQLLMDHKYTSQIEANEGAYGTKSHSTSVVVADQKIKTNDFYATEWNEGYELINRTDYYIVEDGSWQKFTGANQLVQIFKAKKKEIKEFVSEHKTDFHNRDDVKKIVLFALE
ncbi:MAG: hypothetical protein IPL46_33485 [Saprospiraceae bacterium]|nr:hypothetical protein [Saprospiraceae bacterium]